MHPEKRVQVDFTNETEKCRLMFLKMAKHLGLLREEKPGNSVLWNPRFKFLIIRPYCMWGLGGNSNFEPDFGPIVSLEDATDILTGNKRVEDFLPKATKEDIGKSVRLNSNNIIYQLVHVDSLGRCILYHFDKFNPEVVIELENDFEFVDI